MDDLDPLLDDLVVAEIRAGNRQAYGILIDRYQVRLRAVISACLLRCNEIEVVVEKAFVEAFLQLDHYDSHQPFYPWLRTLAMDALRQDLRTQGAATFETDGELRQVLLERATAESADVAIAAELDALDRCLRLLPDDAAALLDDTYRSDHSIAELAARHRTSEDALTVRLLRLHDHLSASIRQRLTADLP